LETTAATRWRTEGIEREGVKRGEAICEAAAGNKHGAGMVVIREAGINRMRRGGAAATPY